MGNEAADASARAHVHRAFPQDALRRKDDVPKKYSDILQHYRLGRRTYPPAHPSLTREEAVTLRKLQTNTYVHGILLHRISPTEHSYICKYCDVPDTGFHVVRGCIQNLSTSTLTKEQREAKLSDPDLKNQRSLVQRAREMAKARGYLE